MRAVGVACLTLTFTFQFLLHGCAITNQGAIDYRYSRPGSDSGNLSPKYTANSTAVNKIQSGDALTVTLKQVYIKDLTEWRTALRFFRGEPATGDVAIVASTCESPCARKFGSDGIRNSKVVYYSNDVREKQFLNLSNLHGVYGPISYNGNPFKIDIYIIELDESGKQTRDLLGSLASLGETFYPPAHPATPILSALADTLIKDDQDDNVFTYSFDLNEAITGSEGETPRTAYLESGHYVLIRSEDREKQIPWKLLAFNSAVGRVVKKDGECEKTLEPDASCFYLDNSYIVLEISKAQGALNNDIQQIIFSNLKSQLASEAGSMQITSEKIATIKSSLESVEVRDQTSDYLRRISESKAGSPERKTAAMNMVSTWFDAERNVLEADKIIVSERFGRLIGRCQSLSSYDGVKYQEAVRSRAISDKAALVSALESCI